MVGRVRLSPVWTVVGISFVWLHGATTGIALGDNMLQRFFIFTIIFVFPVITLWVTATTVIVRRLAASMVYFLCALQATAWSLSIAWYRNPRAIQSLPDLGHDLLGAKWDGPLAFAPFGHTLFEIDADDLPDVFLAGGILGALGFALSQDLRWVIIRRVLTVYATLMFFRCFTILVTSLPDSHPRCREITPEGDMPTGAASVQFMKGNIKELVIRSLQVMVPIGEVTCGDMVFSGHTMLLILSALTWHTYYPRTEVQFNVVKFLVWTWSFCGLFSIIATRLHYTLDVLLAWYLSVTVWSSYHRIVNDVIRGRHFCMVWLFDTLVIYPAIEYFEAGVGREGLCVGINVRTVEEENANPEASPRRRGTTDSSMDDIRFIGGTRTNVNVKKNK